MPKDSTPRSLPLPILKSPGKRAPIVASGTFMPCATFGAPQTICNGASCSAARTWHTRSLSAFGCGSTATTSATTTPVKGGATGSVSSTSRPAIVNWWARSSVEMAGSTIDRSQDSGNCIVSSTGSVELFQEAQIALEELAQIIDAVAQHGQALQARSKRKTDVALRIQTIVAHHRRMHLSRARNFQPAPLVRAGGEHHVDFSRRLGEREERRTIAQHQIIGFKESAQEI